MLLTDAVTEALLRAVLAKPERCPPSLLDQARQYASHRRTDAVGSFALEYLYKVCFLGQVERYAQQLPDILAEE